MQLFQQDDHLCEAPTEISLMQGLQGEGVRQECEGDGQPITLTSLTTPREELSISVWLVEGGLICSNGFWPMNSL